MNLKVSYWTWNIKKKKPEERKTQCHTNPFLMNLKYHAGLGTVSVVVSALALQMRDAGFDSLPG